MVTMKEHESLSGSYFYARKQRLNSNASNNARRNDLPPVNSFEFNPVDLLPTDDYIQETRFTSRFSNCILWIIKLCFISVLIANILSLIIDPTPLVRVYNYILQPSVRENSEQCEVPQADETIFKHFSAKLHILKEDLDELKGKIDALDKWRLNLEYEISKNQRQELEEMGQYFMAIEQRIEEALSIYDADKLGMIDYALETSGGKIISTPYTIPYPSSVSWDFGYFQLFKPSSPTQVIQAGNLPGQCFAFHGTTGRIRIRLAEEINIRSVTLEHSPFRLLADNTSCPKTFIVLGVEKPEDDRGVELGQFVFEKNASLQNFKIAPSTKSFHYVELLIMDNYGKEEYTCVYRFRVHGVTVAT